MPYVAHRRLRQAARRHDPFQIALDQGDARALNRDVGSRSHCNPDIGGRERRRVVHAIARHGDNAPLLAQPLDNLSLVLWKDFGPDFRDTELARDGFGGRTVVAGEHDDPDSRSAQSLNCLRGRRLDRIGDRDHAQALPSIATKIAVAPAERNSSAVFSSADTSIAPACIISRLPMSIRRPSTVPVTPLPEGESKS